jgi:predicted DNA-binding transcriptional regulator AlpA
MEAVSGKTRVLDTDDAAKQVGLSTSTLAKLRLSGRGPAYCKLGRRVVYRPDDLNDWLATRIRRSTSETTPG